MTRRLAFLLAAFLLAGTPSVASAFCGFYVGGADSSLYNSATMVVMMREGERTVLSLQNNYQGPPEDFALVVPVPIVLQEENVKTLPREVFGRVDSLAAPRLVEYWETDPCMPTPPMRFLRGNVRMRRSGSGGGAPPMADLGVTIEAQFAVAEYDIVILSARDSTGLDTWLRQENYNIPRGADRVLRPYVEAGTKFFVAKVDAARVTFEDGRAVLSPLRVHYDSREFSLPVRLGLLNSAGQQDLIVHVLSRGRRFEVANYANTTIPTNIRVKNEVRDSFGDFYDILFRRATASGPRTVVTEYAWDASSCDPCPTPPLTPAEITTLGADVIGGDGGPYGFVLTRLHYRYGREGLNEDLVFREAPPIVGGRGIPDAEGDLSEEGAQESSMNNFQGRYVILHPWEGAIACASPQRGRWGGPPGDPDGNQRANVMGSGNVAMRGAAAPALTAIGPLLEEDIPSIQVTAGAAEAALPLDPGPPGSVSPEPEPEPEAQPPPPLTPVSTETGGGCASCSAADPPSAFFAMAMLLFVLRRRR
jgi:MYXO-CTERM domain-containing protein